MHKLKIIPPGQLPLWETATTASFAPTVGTELAQEFVWPILWADGDSSAPALWRLLSILAQEQTHHLCGYAQVRGGYISFYAHILELWVKDGIIYARGMVTAEGAQARAMMATSDALEVTDEED